MREIRPYGSVRGVRSNPYPYRDPITPDAVGGAGFDLRPFPHHIPPQPAPNRLPGAPMHRPRATLRGSDSPHFRAANRSWAPQSAANRQPNWNQKRRIGIGPRIGSGKGGGLNRDESANRPAIRAASDSG